MKRSIMLLSLATLAACQTNGAGVDHPGRGVASVNVPVVTRADYAFDLYAPDGTLSASEAARLDAWFRSMDLGYGDSIYVDGAYAYGARDEVARVAGNYGLLVNAGAPITPGAVPSGMVRVVVARNRASVPNCPNWDNASRPDYGNMTMPNYGCAVNGAMAAMVANPEDLVHGREGSGVGDNRTSVKALESYRKAIPTGQSGLKDINTKGN